MIYFMQPVDGGPVKIGISVDIEARRKQLEARYGQQLAVLAMMDGGRDEEADLHARFSHLRFGRTEQFRPSADLMSFIGRPLLVGANPDAVEVMPVFDDGSDQVRIRVSAPFKAWLQEYADFRQLTMTDTIVQALIKDAKAEGFKAAPKR